VAGPLRNQFIEQGYTGPIRVLSNQECRQFLLAVADSRNRAPLAWGKGYAASCRAFYEIGAYPAIIEVVVSLLGNDVMLWGASMTHRAPDARHAWHTDTESASAPSGKAVSVWLGLEHTNHDSSLMVIPYSHRIGVTVQEVRHHYGQGRSDTTIEDIVRWAQERDRRCHLVTPQMGDGEALFFDGRLWHGSHNRSGKARQALLLQYAVPDTLIRIPDPNYLDWPLRQLNLPKPGCVMIRGTTKAGINGIVSAPMADEGANPQLTSQVYPLQIPLPPDQEKVCKSYSIFKGATPDVQSLSCHASVLTHGQRPHPPHLHEEEEILLLLSGEVDLIIPSLEKLEGTQRKPLKSGELVYYPAHFAHTLETVSSEPANYLMFKWRSDPSRADSPLAFGHFCVFDAAGEPQVETGLHTRIVFEGPTTYLRTLQCHTSTLTAGAGYDPHIDAYEVAIVVLEGEIETLGERVGPHSVIFYPSGEPHGMFNPGNVTARYVVFEFHGAQTGYKRALPSPAPTLRTKLTDPLRWKRKLKQLLKRISNMSLR